MINCVSGNLDMKLCLEYHICITIVGVLYDWCLWNLFKCQKPVAVALLVWCLAAGSEPLGGKVLKQWQKPLARNGTWRQVWVRQAVMEQRNSCLVLGA